MSASHVPMPRRLRNALVSGLLLCAALARADAGMSIRSGHAGHWFAADRSGEGWVLELRDAGNAWMYWFTYDETGGQRWLTAAGQVVDDGEGGQRIEFPQLVVTHGARFGAAFDPEDVVREAVGSASLRFDGCDSGEFSYNAFNQSQTFAVQRLARVMGTRCETPHGVAGREAAAFAGESGSWFDPAHNGEGYALHWSTPEQAIVTWYSYDDQGRQYWMLGTGHRDGDGRILFSDVHATRGARFGTAFDPAHVERFAWGELTFQLQCGSGAVRYESVLPAFGEGILDLQRLTSLHEVGCPWQRPTLADLYDIDVQALPTTIDGASGERVYAFDALVDGHGTLWTDSSSIGFGLPLRLEAGEPHWRTAGELQMESLHFNRLMLAEDDTVYGSGRLPGDADSLLPVHFVDNAWRPLDMSLPDGAYMTGISASGAHRVGMVSTAGALRQPWQWAADTGLDWLRGSDVGGPSTPPLLVPLWTNEVGSLVVGTVGGLPPTAPIDAYRTFFWRDDDTPRMLTDDDWWLLAPRACARDCGLVFGSAAGRGDPESPAGAELRREPWGNAVSGPAGPGRTSACVPHCGRRH
jgi:hypothetical protein